ATAYSARASEFAGVSTPLRWQELDEPIDPRDFTIVTAPTRFREVGDLWARLRTAKPADLELVFRKYQALQSKAPAAALKPQTGGAAAKGVKPPPRPTTSKSPTTISKSSTARGKAPAPSQKSIAAKNAKTPRGRG
ncbi:MAG: hypothetical protein ABJC51_02640, partial [Acidobacteriota bacterium]